MGSENNETVVLEAKEKTMNTSKRKKLSSMKYLLGQERPVGSCFPTDGNVSVEEDRKCRSGRTCP